MLLAAFMAVGAMAAGPEKRQMKALTPAQVTSSVKQNMPKGKAVMVKAPVINEIKMMAQKAKASARKAPKKAGIADLLSADWMLCSDYYEYDEEAGGLVAATIPAGGHSISFEMTDDKTISISTFTSDATEAIQGTVAATTDEELLAQGVVAEITIAGGQTLLTNDTYGPILLQGLSNEDGSITAYVFENGYVVVAGYWAGVIGGDGQYAGYTWTDYCSSLVLPVNGSMSWTSNKEEQKAPVVIYQDPENANTVTVYNYGGEETAINIKMKEDNTFVIPEQPLVYAGSEIGYLYLNGITSDYYLESITGVGTENTLTFNGNWMMYSGTSLYYLASSTTITLTEGEFIYPVIPNVATVPADPLDIQVRNYNEDNGCGLFIFTIPTTDVDGNDLKEDLLYYQLYSDIKGDIQPITFTPEYYKELSEEMSIIPYTFTDNYDFMDFTTYKVVYMNYKFNDLYDRIGVKSIYTGGGETNESNIVWAEIEKEESAPAIIDATFNFNKMDLPTSSSVTADGDINETKELTEEGITLAISVGDERCTNPNRFWSTSAGPQLRVYSGTLTFTAPEGYLITSIKFNYNGKNWGGSNNAGNVTADSGDITDDATNHQATWTGEAASVIFSFGYYDEENKKWVSGNSQFNSIDVTLSIDGPKVTVGEALYATYVAPFDVYFNGAGVSAYAVQVKTDYAHLEPVTSVPAGTAVVVKAAEAGTYSITKITDEAITLGAENDLITAAADVTADGTQYILAQADGVVGFYQATAGSTIAAGKGYISVASPVKAFYPFAEDDATAIQTIDNGQQATDSAVYNLAGQRLQKMQKGINIVGGKKVLR